MAEPEKTYELKDKNTSFYDDETKLEVTRDQKVAIGPGAGKKTMLMIAKKGLVEVKGEAAPPTGFDEHAGEGKTLDALAEDFPGKAQLAEASYTTSSSLRALSDEDLQGVKGIGKATAEKIRE